MYFWQFYGWTLLFYYYVVVYVQLHDYINKLSIIDWFFLMLSLFCPIGVLLFAYNKKFISKIFWKICFIYWILWFALGFIEKSSHFGYISTSLCSIIFLPSMVALFLYAFKPPQVKYIEQKKQIPLIVMILCGIVLAWGFMILFALINNLK